MKDGMSVNIMLLHLCSFFLLGPAVSYSQPSAKENKATVIFYRNSLWGAAYSYKLGNGDSTLTKVKYKSFYVIELKEGVYNYWAKNAGGRADINLNVKEGHTYLVKCVTSFGLPVRKPKMVLLTDEEAEKESNSDYLKRMLAEHHLKL